MNGPGTARAFDAAGSRSVVAWSAARGWRAAATALVMAVMSASSFSGLALAHDPAQPLRIPLEPMGYEAIMPEFLLAGDSMLTVDFVDSSHLLITFGLRRLMKREPDSPPTDDDRMVGAFLVELPSGKVLARTEWRLHDRSQYLWSLGHGRFLLRVRDRLSMIAPMEPGNGKDPFHETPLLRVERHIVAILVSSNRDLLTVETVKPPAAPGVADNVYLAGTDPAPVQINFYRLTSSGGSSDDLEVVSAGVIRTRMAVGLPMTSAGFLDVLDGGKNEWMFNFDEYAGKVDELAEWYTSCFPRPTFISHSEFVAFGCRGSDDKMDLAGFNLKGEEMWQQNFLDAHVSPTFAFAPAAGRFALGRTIVSGAVGPDVPLVSGLVTGQEVRVYQSYDGKQLFRIDCTPVERAGQNFALSPDGMQLAVVRQATIHHAATKDYDAYTQLETAVEVYTLPPLADADRIAVKAAAQAPADTGARIDLALERASASASAEAGSGTTGSGADSAAPAAAASNAQQAEPSSGGPASGTESKAGSASVVEGDALPDAPRKAPTLYSPGEKPTGNSTEQTPQ